MAGRSGGGAAQRRNRGGGREVDEGGPKSKIPEIEGLHCNVHVTFKPELK
jgi:hypothetical protein